MLFRSRPSLFLFAFFITQGLLAPFLPATFNPTPISELAPLLSPGLADAHILPQERKVIVQVSSDRVEIMIEHLEPPNERLFLLMRRFDLDGDGQLNEAESKLAGNLWIKHVIYGLQFEVIGETPRTLEPQIKFRREQKGALTAAVYARWDLDQLDPEARRSFKIRLTPGENTVPTAVIFEAGEDTFIEEFAVPRRFQGDPAHPILEPGETAGIRVRHAD